MRKMKYQLFRRIDLALGLLLCLILVSPARVDAAVLYLSPERTEVAGGEVVRVPIVLDTEGEEVNAVHVQIPIPDGVEVKGLETGNSVITLWVELPRYDSEAREVRFSGGVPGGFDGQAVLATMLLEVQVDTAVEIGLSRESQVLANDGLGSDVRVILEGTRLEKTTSSQLGIRSATHPDQNQWYRSRELTINWDVKAKAKYSILLDDSPRTSPDDVAEEVKTPLEQKEIPDGIHYFHVREQFEGVWGPPAHFRIQVDGTPPEAFTIDREGNELHWNTTDKASGVLRYRVAFAPWPLKHFLGKTAKVPSLTISGFARFYGGAYVVTATDKAQNVREARAELAGGVGGKAVGGGALATVVILALMVLRRFRG